MDVAPVVDPSAAATGPVVAEPDVAPAGSVATVVVEPPLRLRTRATAAPPIASATMTAAAMSHGPPRDPAGGGHGAGGCAGGATPAGCGLEALPGGGWTTVCGVPASARVPVVDGPLAQATTAQPELSCQHSLWCAAAQAPQCTIETPSFKGKRQ